MNVANLSTMIKDVELIDVSDRLYAAEILYDILRERSSEGDRHVNISHRGLPSWADHVDFFESRPYAAWYLVKVDKDIVGSVYLTHADEIGVVLLRKFRRLGYGPRAVSEIMALHERDRFLANINPENRPSISMFERMGFSHIQNTYELRKAE